MQPQRSSKERRPLSKQPLNNKLGGKTFYLDNVKKQQIILLGETIRALGGKVESFLHKDVDYVVTGSKEGLKQENPAAPKEGVKDKHEGDKQQAKPSERGDKRPGTSRPVPCGSRGKALLEKAIHNNERLQASSVLSNARSWGVKILSVEYALFSLKKLTKERCPARQRPSAVKVTVLKSPYLKIEDISRKYKPLFTAYETFPALCHLGRTAPLQSPPPPPWFEQWAEQREHKTREKKVQSSLDKFRTTSHNLPWLIGKKKTSYCECCQQVFTSLKEHLRSDQHHKFAMTQSNYSMLDEVVAGMVPAFGSTVFQQSEETLIRPSTPLPVDDFGDMELQIDESKQAEQDFFFNTLTVGVSGCSPSCSPPAALPGARLTEPKLEDVTTEMTNFTPETPSQLPDNPSPASNCASPVLNDQDSPSQQPEAQHRPSCPDEPHSPDDASSLPPVLSPEIPYPCYMMEPHSSYSDLPVLSPQQPATDEAAAPTACDVNFLDIVSEFLSALMVPVATPPRLSGAFENSEETDEESSGRIHSNRGSHSVPRLLKMKRSRKKRRLSASSDHNSRKRRRTSQSGRTGRTLESMELQCDNMTESEGCLEPPQLTAEVSLTHTPCASDILGPRQTHTTSLSAHAQHHTDSFASRSPDLPSLEAVTDRPLDLTTTDFHSPDTQRSQQHATSVCIEQALIPDPAALTPSSSDSEWDCGLLSRLGPPSAVCPPQTGQNCELDKELLHRPCPWTYGSSYESHLHSILQQSTPCGDEKELPFSRTVVQVAEVQ